MGFSRIVDTFLILLLVGSSCQADTLSDAPKERRWAEQIVDTLFDGEVVWLNADGHEFLGIEMESTDAKTKRAAIVIHGSGVHPNWEQVIKPLRVGMSENDWHTLSIQMPILENDAATIAYKPLFQEVSGRINAAIKYLRSKGIFHFVIVSHSMGAAMVSHYLVENPDSPVEAAALIGIGANAENNPVDVLANLRQIQIPLLDLFGSEDLPEVIDSALHRIIAAEESGNHHYYQVKVEAANHFFDNREEVLLDQVTEWLQQFNRDNESPE